MLGRFPPFRLHTCPILPKWVESSLCIDESSWQKSCRESHEVIHTVSWHTLQEVWLHSPEIVILSEWGWNMSSSRHDSTRVDTTRYFWKSTRLMARNALADKRNNTRSNAMYRSVNLCRQVIRFNEMRVQETKLCIQTSNNAMYTSF